MARQPQEFGLHFMSAEQFNSFKEAFTGYSMHLWGLERNSIAYLKIYG